MISTKTRKLNIIKHPDTQHWLATLAAKTHDLLYLVTFPGNPSQLGTILLVKLTTDRARHSLGIRGKLDRRKSKSRNLEIIQLKYFEYDFNFIQGETPNL